jgi:hypothetical protein
MMYSIGLINSIKCRKYEHTWTKESNCDREGLRKVRISSSTKSYWCHVMGNNATSIISSQGVGGIRDVCEDFGGIRDVHS